MFVPDPAVIEPPAEIVQVYPVMAASVEYVTPVVPAQTVAKPVIVGTGKAFTVTFLTVAEDAVQELALV